MNYQDPLFERPEADDLAGTPRGAPAARFDRAGALSWRERLTAVRRARRGLAVWIAACVGLALAYCVAATPKFISTTDVVLEPRQPVLSTDPAAQSTAPTLDSALADSQVEVLTSRRNLQYVFDAQNLASDPEFANPGFDLIGWALDKLPGFAPAPASPEEQARRAREAAFERFASGVSARRLAQSYAFELAYSAETPAKAARLANAITAAYIRDKLNYNIAAAAAQRGGDFLKTRVADVKAEQDAADEAVRTGVIPELVFGHADARIISAAVEPLRKSSPKTTLILLLAGAFALASGAGGVFLADELDRRVRSPRRLRALTGISALAALPAIRAGRRRSAVLLRQALDEPDGDFAAGMRNLRVAALQVVEVGRPSAVGVLSYRRGEGASLIAANLAALIAQTGARTALVDGDVFDPALTRAFAPEVEAGWADAPGADAVSLMQPVDSRLSLLPARSLYDAPDPNGFLAFPLAAAACAALAKSHFVVADLTAVSPSPEGAAVARGLSGVFVVIDAKTATADECVELLDRLAELDVRLLGVALNRAELS